MSRETPTYLLFMMLLLAIFSPQIIQINAEQDYLIVRVVDADYPPEESVFEDENWTGFTITFHYQIENPTSSPIVIPYSCGPYPFPYMRINLRDKNLKVIRNYIIKWVAGEKTILPGNITENYKCSFAVENYVNNSLPIGVYTFWFDFTNCSISPIPVITEKMYIDVTETSVTYYFDYNNESSVVSSIQQTDYQTSFFIISSVLMIVLYNRLNRIKRKKL